MEDISGALLFVGIALLFAFGIRYSVQSANEYSYWKKFHLNWFYEDDSIVTTFDNFLENYKISNKENWSFALNQPCYQTFDSDGVLMSQTNYIFNFKDYKRFLRWKKRHERLLKEDWI